MTTGSPRSRRTLRMLAAVLLILALVASVVVFLATRDDNLQLSGEPAAPAATSDPASKATSTPSQAPDDKDKKEPALGNDGPAPQNIGTFTMTGPAAVTGATFDSMPYALPLNPAGPQETMVRWVEGWGQPPSNAQAGTVYVLGHAWGQAPLVFNPISEVVTGGVDLNTPPQQVNGTDNMPVKRYSSAVLNGSEITMKDAQNHARTWKVTRSWLVDKNEAIVDPDIMAAERPGRIILIACSVSGAQDLGYNVIVEGQLV